MSTSISDVVSTYLLLSAIFAVIWFIVFILIPLIFMFLVVRGIHKIEYYLLCIEDQLLNLNNCNVESTTSTNEQTDKDQIESGVNSTKTTVI